MAPREINVFISSFGGLGLPSTFNLICPETIHFRDLLAQVEDAVPHLQTELLVTTNSNRKLEADRTQLSTLLYDESDNFIPLRLSVPVYGGKGGFGSQLRAAGGRMSSKRKKAQGENNGSNRNLDGRRLRTVNEAKALAEYLALKPDMERIEQEERKKRWQQVIDLAEKKEEGLRNGSRGKVDGKWVEEKEEAGERTREAVLAIVKNGYYHDNLQDAKISVSRAQTERTHDASTPDHEQDFMAPTSSSRATSRSYVGFDDDDEFLSDTDEDITSPNQGGSSRIVDK